MGVVQQARDSSWGASDVVSRYDTCGFSDAGEEVAFAAVGEWARGDVLDIGVGGGRTTGVLAGIASTYVGLDLSLEMLDLARRRFPGQDLREGNAVDLRGLPDAAHDLVVFSFNGLDALDHSRRGAALAAMARVTRPGGRVVFSSLNLDGASFDERPWRVAGGLLSPRFRFHLADAARHPRTVVRSVRNYRRTRQRAEDGSGWALRPLRAHEFRFLVHFATMEETVAEAAAAGLEVVAAYADDGRELAPDTAHTDADYVHFVCRRRPVGPPAAES
jgi:ubiquinone/menaquinone biosynthesis C-methylase UbiE